MGGSLATGHPWIATEGGFDVAPLVFGLLILAGLRLAGWRVRPWAIPIALLAGLVIDDLSDASGDSTLTAGSLIVALSCAAALRRPISRRRAGPAV